MKAIGILLLDLMLSSGGTIQPVSGAAGYNDVNSYPPPDYTNFQPPPLGGFYVDPTFGVAVKRASDALRTRNEDSGGNLISITTEYATVNPFNMDHSRLILVHNSYFGLYDGDGNFLRSLPLEISTVTEPRWSRHDPAILYYHVGNQLKQHNVNTQESGVVRTFGEYSFITSKGEADISLDGNHLVFAGDDRYVFTYELSSNSTSPVLDTGGRRFDSLAITAYNNVVISWLQTGSDRFTGVELYDRNMRFYRQLTRAPGHMDVTREANGEEVLVWFNSADPAPICENGIVKVRMADGQQTCLLTLDWGLAGHVSATDHSWVMAETYAPSDPSTANWKPFTNEIFLIKLDGTQIRRLATHRSRPFNSYNYQPRATISHDARRVVFSSNYGLQGSAGYPGEYSDVYLAYVW
jgi:hypothetical protein